MIYKIKHVPYFSQRDNRIKPYVSCYPTSMAMLVQFCLDYIGASKAILGCSHEIQLEDFLNTELSSEETRVWIKNNVSRFGSWMLRYRPRTIAVVEEMIFNKLMNRLNFTCKFTIKNADDFSGWFIKQKFPVAIHGNFKKVSSVGGHICCLTGMVDSEHYIVHDPFGNALSGYTEKTGFDRIYHRSFFLKKKNVWYQKVSFNPEM